MKEKTFHFLLRLAIAFAFLYPAVAIHINPDSWIAYFPDFIRTSVPLTLLIYGFSALHLIIGLWILSGKKIFIPSVVASIFLAGVLVFNWQGMDVLFRDISLMFVTIALAVESYKK